MTAAAAADRAPDGPGSSYLQRILAGFAEKVNGHKLVQKMMKDWTRNIVLDVTDAAAAWTLAVVDGKVQGVRPGRAEPAHVTLAAPEAVLAGIFEGKLNPAREFAAGRLKFSGSSKDEMRLDAVVQYVWK